MSRRPLLTGVDVALLVAALAAVAAGPARAQELGYRFIDASEEAGVDFVYLNGASGERYMQETMGSGLGLIDLDVDGWLDLYFAQGSPSPGHPEEGASWRWRIPRTLPRRQRRTWT